MGRVWETAARGLVVGGLLGVPAPSAGSAQEADSLLVRPARLEAAGVTVADGLRALQRSSGVAIAFSPDVVPGTGSVSCACRDLTVAAALDRLLAGTGLTYREGSRQVLVGRASPGEPGARAATLVGLVVDEESGRPVPAAEVVVADGGGRRALTGDDGRFVLPGLAPGPQAVAVQAFGYRPARAEADLPAGVGSVHVALARAPIPLSEIVIAPGRFGVLEATPGASGVTVSREDIEATPQIGDDVFRTLKRMPGVSTDDVSTRLSVRGGAPRDVLVRLDGLPLYEPYHLKDLDGALGIVDVQALGGIDLVTGGFPVEFGDGTAGLFDMHSRRPPGEGTRTTLGMSLSSLSAISQGSWAEGRGQWLASLRRGFLEYVLAVTDVDDDLKPTYWDALVGVRYLLSDDHAVSARILYAGDDMRWSDEETGSGVRSAWTNGYGWLTWQGSPSDRLRVETLASVGRLTRDRTGSANNPGRGEFSPLTSDVRDVSTVEFAGVRQDLRLDLTDDLLVKAGAEVRASSADYDYASSATRFALTDDDRLYVATESTAVVAAPSGTEVAGWGALRGRTGPLTWEGGVRYDRYSLTDDAAWSPRLLVRWDTDRSGNVRASWGRYVQGQGIHELDARDGQTSFHPVEVARQAAVGVERRFGDWTARVEGYHRTVAAPLPEYVNLSREINPIPEVEADRTRIQGAEARARGLEVLLARDGTGPVSWSAAWALAWSEALVDGVWRPRTLDQRHTINLAGAWRMGSAWQLSGSWQYHTGWPYTAQILDVVVTEGIDGPQQVEVLQRGFGPLNAGRLPPYHRLDLRLTRSFELRRSRLELYLDVFNVYDRTNLRGLEWLLRRNADGTYRAERDSGEEQLPLMPTLGFRWVF